ncbi:MAG: hypothetical protein AAFV19_14385 [Pseudomonadota bacterium]
MTREDIFTLQKPVFDSDLLLCSYHVEDLRVDGPWLRRVAARFGKDVLVCIDPRLDARAHVRPYPPAERRKNGPEMEMVFRDEILLDFTLPRQALVVHETVHALFNWTGKTPKDHILNEAAAHIAEALFFRLKGADIVENWAKENPEYFKMAWLDDPYTPRAKAFQAANALVDAHGLATPLERQGPPPRLSRQDIDTLYQALKQVPDYKR